MEFLNIGPIELILILLIAFVFLGPKDMVKTWYRVGNFVRDLPKNPLWREMTEAAHQFSELGRQLVEESEVKDTIREFNAMKREIASGLNLRDIDNEKNAAARPNAREEKQRENSIGGSIIASASKAAQVEPGSNGKSQLALNGQQTLLPRRLRAGQAQVAVLSSNPMQLSESSAESFAPRRSRNGVQAVQHLTDPMTDQND